MKNLAKKRVVELMELALEIYDEEPDLANRYVTHAREIAMSAKVKIPLQFKRKICHGCKRLLVPGKSARFRTHRRKGYGSFLSVTCLECAHITRFIFKGPNYDPDQLHINK